MILPLKKKKVLVLGGNDAQVPYIQELKKRGFWVALTDINESAPGRACSDRFCAIGYEDSENLIAFAASIGLTLDDYIFTAAAQFAHVGAAAVAEACGIKYPKPKTIEICLDKTKYYPEFQQFGIPIPETEYVQDFYELKKIVEISGGNNVFYLKSDFSKNPQYVYRFKKHDLDSQTVFWGRDRYLRQRYVLQEEVQGRHLRLNIFPGGYAIFDFKENTFVSSDESKRILLGNNVLETLNGFLNYHRLSRWLVKFDLIIHGNHWVALDIGLDPPMRMKSYVESAGGDFVKSYVGMHLNGEFSGCDVWL